MYNTTNDRDQLIQVGPTAAGEEDNDIESIDLSDDEKRMNDQTEAEDHNETANILGETFDWDDIEKRKFLTRN